MSDSDVDVIAFPIPATPEECIDTFFPSGLVEQDGKVVGIWVALTTFGDKRDGEVEVVRVEMHAALRAAGGNPVAVKEFLLDRQRGDTTPDLWRRRAESTASYVQGAPDEIIASQIGSLDTRSESFLGVLRLLGIVRDNRCLPSEGDERGDHKLSIARAIGHLYPDADVLEVVERLVECKVERFARTLGQQALAYVNSRNLPSQPHPNWVNNVVWKGIDDTFTPGGPLRRHLVAAPMHVDLLTNLWHDRPDHFAADAAPNATSDAFGAPPPPDTTSLLTMALHASHQPGPTSVVRAFLARAESLKAIGQEHSPGKLTGWTRISVDKTDPSRMLKILAFLPLDWVPTEPDEWHAVAALTKTLNLISWKMGATTPRLVNAKGRWREFESRLVAAAGTENLLTAATDVADMVNSFHKQIAIPCLSRMTSSLNGPTTGNEIILPETDAHAPWRLLFEGRSLPRILEESRKWHAHQAAIDAAIAALSPEIAAANCWKPGLPSLRIGNVEVVVLTTQAQLTDEGARSLDSNGMMGLAHCVGGYAVECHAGKSRIVSIRRGDEDGRTERLSTAELMVGSRSGDAWLSARQHRGQGNSTPPGEAVEALREYVAMCRDGTHPVRPDELEPSPRDRAFPARCGYDWRREGLIEEAIKIWSPCLPRRVRGLGPNGIAEFIAKAAETM